MFVFALNLNRLYGHVELGWLQILVNYLFSDYFYNFCSHFTA